MNKLLKIIIIAVVIIIAIILLVLFYLTRGLRDVQSLQVDNVDLSYLEDDGIYPGQFEFGRWSNKLEVTVEDKEIIDINIVDDVTFAKDEVREEIFNNIIETQKINVDAVSGATATSNAYKKAVENALDILH